VTDHDQPAEDILSRIDTSVPHSARIWNFFLGGKDNFDADRAVGERVKVMLPSIVRQAKADRDFLRRAVTHLVEEEGIRQFLAIGTGLPTLDNTHEVAQGLAPDARIVYVDNDPVVLAHARALLTSSPEGATDYIDADLRDPGLILERAAATLDFEKPVAVMLVGILHHLEDTEESYAIVRRLMERLPSGSTLAINHSTYEVFGEQSRVAAQYYNDNGGRPSLTLRPADEILRYFDGLDLIEPGLVSCSRWRTDPDHVISDEVDEFAGVARKP
jgi:O-methyltransferase involved in polyketide biosynthesis